MKILNNFILLCFRSSYSTPVTPMRSPATTPRSMSPSRTFSPLTTRRLSTTYQTYTVASHRSSRWTQNTNYLNSCGLQSYRDLTLRNLDWKTYFLLPWPSAEFTFLADNSMFGQLILLFGPPDLRWISDWNRNTNKKAYYI